MRLPIAWLRDLVDFKDSALALADRLTHAGLKVDLVYRWRGARDKLVAVDVRSVEPVAGSDHLSRCVIFDGRAERVVVCGAPNVRAGSKAALALPGCELPGGLVVGEREVRGVRSFGMLVSEREIGLSDDHAGILSLPADLPAGTPFADWCDRAGAALELDITANRGDAQSVLGVARDVAALCGTKVKDPWRAPKAAGGDPAVAISIECPDLCRRYAGRVVRGVKVGPSPGWLAERLRGVGARPINNVVDVTNYVLFLTGHPIHAFDLAKLAGPSIVVRRPKAGETIRTLDGVERTPPADTCLICDAARPVAVGGVMGGADSGVTEGTTDLLIEVACFDAASVRRTSKLLGLKSDSSYRFERGIDEEDTARVLELAACLLEEVAGGHAAGKNVDVRPGSLPEVRVELDLDRLDRFVGEPIPAEEAVRILAALGFTAVAKGARRYEVAVPSWRHDVAIPEDLAEEILRVRGYNTVRSTLPATAAARPVASGYARLQQARDAARAVGYSETVSYAFLAPEAIDPFDAAGAERATLRNALGREFSTMRPTLLPSLCALIAGNRARGNADLALFEQAPVYRLVPARGTRERTTVRLSTPAGERDVVESAAIAFALAARRDAGWNGRAEPLDFFDFKGTLEEFARQMRIRLETVPPEAPVGFLHPGMQATVLLDGRPCGFAGRIHPDAGRRHDLPPELLLAELDLGAHLSPVAPAKVAGFSRFPAARFDLALLVAREVPHARVADALSRAAGPLLVRLDLFDLYEGERIAPGTKSLAYTLTFQAEDRTLTDDEVKGAVARAVDAVAAGFGAKLREM